MAATDLIDDHVSAKQCKLAVDALLKHEKRRTEKAQDSQLLPGKEQHVWLQITVKQMHAEKKLKPHRMYVCLNSILSLAKHNTIPDLLRTLS